MLAQRYALVHQRLLRHELFRPSHLSHMRSHHVQHKLTPIESLLGKSSATTTGSILVLGILIQIEQGQFYLEDPTGQVLVSFQTMTTPIEGCFVTEQCILLVEGTFDDGIFYVARVGHPLLEARETSLRAIRQQVAHPYFDSGRHKKNDEDNHSSFVFLSDLHLDQPSILQQLEGLLAGYETSELSELPLFCLMGNFSSQPHLLKQSLDDLGHLIASRFPRLAADAHFCLVPGPLDHQHPTGLGPVILPMPSLQSSLGTTSAWNRVQHVHWASNPCRLQWKGQEIVVFAYELGPLIQREQVLLQPSLTTATMDVDDDEALADLKHRRLPHCRLLKTILDQGHLVPVAGVPIYWNYDAALSLYPLPTMLVLGGGSDCHGVDGKGRFHEIYGNCHVVSPGSWGREDGSHAIVQFNLDSENDMDDENAIVVEFGNVE